MVHNCKHPHVRIHSTKHSDLQKAEAAKLTKLNKSLIHRRTLTGTAQTGLIKAPDELSTQVTPGEVGVTVGLELVTRRGVSSLETRSLDGDAVSDQTHHMEEAWVVGRGRRRRTGHGRSQLDGITHTEVLQLDQFTFRHPDLEGDRHVRPAALERGRTLM